MTIGERIQMRMDEAGMSRRYVCFNAGISESTLCRYLKNNREPKLDTIVYLAAALKVSPGWLAFGQDDKYHFRRTNEWHIDIYGRATCGECGFTSLYASHFCPECGTRMIRKTFIRGDTNE